MTFQKAIMGLWLLCGTVGLAQKQLQRSWQAAGFQSVEIVSDIAYTIDITSATTKNIELAVTVAGETYEHLVLNISEAPGRTRNGKRSLRIETDFAPFFVAENDKLAAHKVLAVEMRLLVPVAYDVVVESASASVSASGTYGAFSASLEQGRCSLDHFYGDALLQTKQGDIEARVLPSVGATARTTYGTLNNSVPKNGSTVLVAESIWGDITLSQTE